VADAQTRWKMKNSTIPSHFVSTSGLLASVNGKSNASDTASGVSLHSLDALAAFNGLDEFAFESVTSLEDTLKIASELLKDGGYFFGIVIDSSEMWTKMLKIAPKNSFATSKGLAQARFENLQQLNTSVNDIDHYGVSKFTGTLPYIYMLCSKPHISDQASSISLRWSTLLFTISFISHHSFALLGNTGFAWLNLQIAPSFLRTTRKNMWT